MPLPNLLAARHVTLDSSGLLAELLNHPDRFLMSFSEMPATTTLALSRPHTSAAGATDAIGCTDYDGDFPTYFCFSLVMVRCLRVGKVCIIGQRYGDSPVICNTARRPDENEWRRSGSALEMGEQRARKPGFVR